MATYRILFVDHTARMGGGEIALLNLIAAIDRGRYVPVVLLFADGPLREKLSAAGIETHLLPLSADVGDARKDALGKRPFSQLRTAVQALWFVGRVRSAILRIQPAVVHTNSLKADIIGGLAGRLAGAAVIWHVRDRIADDYLPPRVAAVFRWLARRIPHFVIANSQSTLRTLDKETPGVAIPSGITDFHPWQVIHDGTQPLSDAALGVPKSDLLVVGLVGRLARWKGQHVFVEAARLLRSRCPSCRFQIIGSALFGENDYEREIRQTVDREGLTGVVEFTGFRSDVSEAIASLDILVHASITGEPFGQVIVEGMTAGKPVIATNGGGVPEIVEDGKTGLLVPMGDAPAMADAIERLAGDPALRLAMGQAGWQRVSDHFTIAHTVEKVQRVYDMLLGQPDGAGTS